MMRIDEKGVCQQLDNMLNLTERDQTPEKVAELITELSHFLRSV